MGKLMAKIELKQIQELRSITGLGMMDCKKALEEAGGNIEKAVELLRKKGAAVAQKRADRNTAEGIIQTYIHPGDRLGVMIEINCETDFVARNENMHKFAKDICLQVAAMSPTYVSPEDIEASFLAKERAIFEEQLKDSGKPAHVVEKIVEGQLKKVCAEICLLKQPFIKNEKMTVEQLLQELIAKTGENIRIKRFVRFMIGE